MGDEGFAHHIPIELIQFLVFHLIVILLQSEAERDPFTALKPEKENQAL